MNVFRTGLVVEIDTARCFVRVQFPDVDAIVSYWLPVLQLKTLLDKTYWMPDINEHVACLMDNKGEEGVVLGAIYSAADSTPVNSKDKRHVRFDDGTILEYDRAAHKLFADVKGEVEIITTGKVVAQIGGTLTATVTGATQITTPTCKIIGDTTIIGTLTTSGLSTLQGGILSTGLVSGSTGLNVTGNIVASGSIIDGGSNTNHHSHP
jgi:phage baseplate assembly protein V